MSPTIPYRDQAIEAKDACKLFAKSKSRFLRDIASQPTFPARVSLKPAAWIVGEVLDWRDRHRAQRPNYAKAA